MKNLLFISLLLLYSMSLCSRSVKTQADAIVAKVYSGNQISESDCKSVLNKYSPYFRLHRNEPYWPQRIEDFGINWSTAVKYQKDQQIPYTNRGMTYNANVPLYASCKSIGNRTLRLTYNLLFCYNGCGARMYVNIKALGKTIFNKDKSVCPMGEHYLDKQYVIMDLKSNNSYFYYGTIRLSYHDKEHVLNSSQLSWSNNSHPIVYLAKGSHASYPKSGRIEYKELYQARKKNKYNISVVLKDDCSDNSNELRLVPKVLKYEGTVVSGLSNDEMWYAYWCNFKIGVNVTYSASQSDAYSMLKDAGSALKKAGFKGKGNDLKDLADSLNGELNTGTPGKCIGAKDWWTLY